MTNKCIVCGQAAFLFRVEERGGRSYLCNSHTSPEDIGEMRLMADEGDGADSYPDGAE